MERTGEKFNKVRFAILNILLAAVLLLYLFGSTAGVYVTSVTNDTDLRNATVTKLMNSAFDGLGDKTVDELENIQNELIARPEIQSITDKYTQAFISGIWHDKEFTDIDVDISADVDSLARFIADKIKEYVNMSVLDSYIENLVVSQEEAAIEAIEAYAGNMYDEARVNAAVPIKIYYIITLKPFLLAMVLAIVILTGILLYTTPLRVSKISVPVLCIAVGALYYAVVRSLSGRVVMELSSIMMGQTVTMDIIQMYKVAGTMIGIAAASCAVLFAADLIQRKNKNS